MTQLTRRRFLVLSAASLATPATAAPVRWHGHALGAEISLTLRAPQDVARPAITAAITLIRQIEQTFSLYQATSTLSQLNQKGQIATTPLFADLLPHIDHMYHLTEGLFDPTVQALYNRHPNAATLVDWSRVQHDKHRIRLAPEQSLTLNGIAQGYATELVTRIFETHGLTDILVNIGEHAARGGPWRLGLADPTFGLLGTRTLTSGAIATSSPRPQHKDSHILHPHHKPRWSTLSVEADTATLADGLSTALCLADLPLIRQIATTPGIRRITLVDTKGNLRTF